MKDISKLETLLEIIKQHCILCDGDDDTTKEELNKFLRAFKIIPRVVPPHLLFLDSNGTGVYSISLSREQYNTLRELFY